MTDAWPTEVRDLEELQRTLARAAATAERWTPPSGHDVHVAAAFVAFPRGQAGAGREGDAAHVGAALAVGGRVVGRTVVNGRAGAPYVPGLLALREGRLLEEGLVALGGVPDVVLIDATGRDHSRGAGLALHLGWVLDVPTIGVTDRPLLGMGSQPVAARGAVADLLLDGRRVGLRMRTVTGARPVVVHAAWRTDPQTAADVVLRLAVPFRTPLPLREARRLARTARAAD